MSDIDVAAGWLSEAGSVVTFGGAGLSKAAGIATYGSSGCGRGG